MSDEEKTVSQEMSAPEKRDIFVESLPPDDVVLTSGDKDKEKTTTEEEKTEETEPETGYDKLKSEHDKNTVALARQGRENAELKAELEKIRIQIKDGSKGTPEKPVDAIPDELKDVDPDDFADPGTPERKKADLLRDQRTANVMTDTMKSLFAERDKMAQAKEQAAFAAEFNESLDKVSAWQIDYRREHNISDGDNSYLQFQAKNEHPTPAGASASKSVEILNKRKEAYIRLAKERKIAGESAPGKPADLTNDLKSETKEQLAQQIEAEKKASSVIDGGMGAGGVEDTKRSDISDDVRLKFAKMMSGSKHILD